MNYGKALEEVWEWRESLAKEIEGMTPEEQRKHINNTALKACKKYGIKYGKKSYAKRHPTKSSTPR
jgi:hypothetical protein